MKISLNITENGSPIVHPSVCMKKLVFIVNVTSVAKFNIRANWFQFFSLYI